MAKKKIIPKFKARISKRINNLSRAINKIDPDLRNKTRAVEFTISDIKPGINDVTYFKDGEEQRVRFDEISTLGLNEQASLLNQLSQDRFNLRQERAVQQLQEKGKLTRQFKQSLAKDSPVLLENIEQFEEMTEGSQSEGIKFLFEELDISAKDFLDETDSFFQGPDGSPELFDFYRPGEAGGFSELNMFTWAAYQALKGI